MRIPGGTLAFSVVFRARFKPRRQPAEQRRTLADPLALRPLVTPRRPAPFADPPRSIRSFRGSVARYVKPPTSSLDWMGAEWSSPVSLSFEETTISAERLGMSCF